MWTNKRLEKDDFVSYRPENAGGISSTIQVCRGFSLGKEGRGKQRASHSSGDENFKQFLDKNTSCGLDGRGGILDIVGGKP